MGGSQAEHHVRRRDGQTEDKSSYIAGNHLADSTHDNHDNNHIDGVPAFEKYAYVDKHSHTNQEIGDEDGITDKLQSSHQWGKTWDITVECQSGKESTKHTFQTYKCGDSRTKKQDRKDEDKLCDGIAVMLQEPARHSGYNEDHSRQIDSQFQKWKNECSQNGG